MMVVVLYVVIFLAGVGGLEHVFFFHILGIIIPTDELIFQRGRSTTNQLVTLVYLNAD